MQLNNRTKLRCAHRALAAFVCVALNSQGAQADILGFGDYTTDWRYQQLDGAAPLSALPTSSGIRLANAGGGDQWRNYFNANTQNVSQFTASFTYQGGTGLALTGMRSGIAMTIFASPFGTDGSTLSGGNTGEWGYTSGNPTQNPLNPSVALVLQNPDSFGRTSGAGLYSNHIVSGSVPASGPVYLGNVNRPIIVSVRYNQPGDLSNFLYFTLVDLFSGETYAPAPTLMNVPEVLGTTNAYIGFTTYSNTADQIISDFSFRSIPTPGVAGILAMSSLLIVRRRR